MPSPPPLPPPPDDLSRIALSPELDQLLLQLTGGKARFVLVWAREGRPPAVMTNGPPMPAVYMLEEAVERMRRDELADRG